MKLSERIATLYLISRYAEYTRQQLLNDEKPTALYIDRMAELAQTIQREYDDQWQTWADEQWQKQNLSCTK